MSADIEFDLDLSDFDEAAPQRPQTPVSGESIEGMQERAEEELERLLRPYSAESVDKARKLFRLPNGLTETKREGQSAWYTVAGSRVYVVKVTTGEDFQFAECSCPNGLHRGGDANCYHSIAARVAESGIVLAGLFADGGGA